MENNNNATNSISNHFKVSIKHRNQFEKLYTDNIRNILNVSNNCHKQTLFRLTDLSTIDMMIDLNLHGVLCR